MAKRFEAKSVQEAWDMVNTIFPTDYEKDEASSQRAGYSVYRSTAEDRYYDYICDLGDRLEINLHDGNRTINIWIVKEEKPEIALLPSKEEIKEAASHQYTFEPERVRLVRVFASGYEFESTASQTVYRAMRDNEDCYQSILAGDMVEAYCEDKGIEWGTIRVISITHYSNTKGAGHYVIEAIVGARTKG